MFTAIKMGNLLHQANEKTQGSEPNTETWCRNRVLFIAMKIAVLSKANSECIQKETVK